MSPSPHAITLALLHKARTHWRTTDVSGRVFSWHRCEDSGHLHSSPHQMRRTSQNEFHRNNLILYIQIIFFFVQNFVP